jgi:hypothetical protein
VPGMGLVTSSAGGSETRPAGHDAGLPGAGCPGRGSVVRDHEARDRTEPSLRNLARAAVERRKASASPERESRAATNAKQGVLLVWRARGIYPRLSALRLPVLCLEAVCFVAV